jgi:hypothetical protein
VRAEERRCSRAAPRTREPARCATTDKQLSGGWRRTAAVRCHGCARLGLAEKCWDVRPLLHARSTYLHQLRGRDRRWCRPPHSVQTKLQVVTTAPVHAEQSLATCPGPHVVSGAEACSGGVMCVALWCMCSATVRTVRTVRAVRAVRAVRPCANGRFVGEVSAEWRKILIPCPPAPSASKPRRTILAAPSVL